MSVEKISKMKKVLYITFITVFFGVLLIPLLCTSLTGSVVSEAENRLLAARPKIYDDDGNLNKNVTLDFEAWFEDHVGFRSDLVLANARFLYYGFDVLTNTGDCYLGPNGELNYATWNMLQDYAHVNLRSEEELEEIAASYQIFNDYLEGQGIQYYYLQCWDKHSIYPEYFMDSVIQYGNVSKTDQIMDALINDTSVDVILIKEMFLSQKDEYDFFSVWGDASHWTERGAFVAYQALMEEINAHNNEKYLILQEDDYEITLTDQGSELFGGIHQEDYLEKFSLKEPKAYRTEEEPLFLSPHQRESRTIFVNDHVDNDDVLLVIGDSYIDHYIIDDLAESFSKTVMVWGEYTREIERLVEYYHPTIVINENAERSDETSNMVAAAKTLRGEETKK